MEDRRIGLALRALRRRRGLRQRDVAHRAGVRQQAVSDLERGRLDNARLGTVRRVAAVLDAWAVVELRWRGGQLDRLLDERHAALVEHTAGVLERAGWEVRPEVSFQVGAASGSVDLLGWRPDVRVAVVVEVKSELTSIEETLRRYDVKLRVAPQVVREVTGWEPVTVGTLLVLPESTSARRRVADHPTIFRARFPDAGRDVRRWLARPDAPFQAVWFMPVGPPAAGRPRGTGGAHRIRRPG